MRHNKIRKQLAKPAPHYTTAEKLHKRRTKRKLGPSAQRRAAKRREVVAVMDCGCKRTRFKLLTCAEHTAPLIEPTNEQLASAQAEDV